MKSICCRVCSETPFKAIAISLLMCAAAGSTAASSDVARGWKAGVARAVITPDEPMWMAGYASRTRPAEGKLHDLWAKALALEDAQGRRAVLVTLDLCGIDRQFTAEVCAALMQKHGLQRSQIVVCASHTHSGPVVERNLTPMYFIDEVQRQRVAAYTKRLREQVIAIAGQALGRLEPAALHWGQGHTDFAVNRRNNKEEAVPELRAQDALRGPVDHDVPVLAVQSEKGQRLAIVFGYACHATVLSGYQWSGDYPGYAQVELEQSHPGSAAMFVAGCGGDQNPLPRRKVELAQEYGRKLAAAVDEVLRGTMQKVDGALRASFREIDLPLADLPSREQLHQDSQSQDKYVASRAQMLIGQIEAGRPLMQTYPYPAQSWRLGNSAHIVWLGGEVVVDYSLRLKRELAPRQVWIAAYANDVMAYIPSRRVLAEGGYEGGGAMVYYGLASAWSENVETLIVEEVLRQARAEK